MKVFKKIKYEACLFIAVSLMLKRSKILSKICDICLNYCSDYEEKYCCDDDTEKRKYVKDEA